MSRPIILVLCLASVGGVLAGAVSDQAQVHQMAQAAQFDSPAYKIISDEDRANMQLAKNHIEAEFANFKNVDEVFKFLDMVKLLVQKHPKNIAFAQGDLKDLHKFLSQEMVTRLIRVDTLPFEMPLNDDNKMSLANRAVQEDELLRKLFGGPLRTLDDERQREKLRPTGDGSHRDGNFFANFWCRLSGNCSN